MSIAETLQNRKNLERAGKLPHDPRFDDLEHRANQHILIVVALLTAAAYALGVDIYYKTKYTAAMSGEIKAKSEMSKADIRSLNVTKDFQEKCK